LSIALSQLEKKLMPRAEIGSPETVLLRPNFHASLSPPHLQRLTSCLMHSWAYQPRL
jgi:hypothetical protein